MLPAPMSRDSASRRLLDRMLAAGPPMESDDWSLTPEALELVLEQVAAGRDRIVECGSGLSTVDDRPAAARARRRRRCTRSSTTRAGSSTTRRRIASRDSAASREVIDAPLEPGTRPPPSGCPWYAAARARAAAGVGSRPAAGRRAAGRSRSAASARSRYPALPLLAGRLAPGATVILDDAEREGERWVLERWEREHGVRFERRGRVAVATLG